MKEQLVSFKIAILAKEKGFKESVRFYYYDNYEKPFVEDITDKNSWITYLKSDTDLNSGHNFIYSAPTQSLLQKWLREKYKINVWVFPRLIKDGYKCAIEKIKDKRKNKTILTVSFNTYEEALEVGLQEALKLI